MGSCWTPLCPESKKCTAFSDRDGFTLDCQCFSQCRPDSPAVVGDALIRRLGRAGISFPVTPTRIQGGPNHSALSYTGRNFPGIIWQKAIRPTPRLTPENSWSTMMPVVRELGSRGPRAGWLIGAALGLFHHHLAAGHGPDGQCIPPQTNLVRKFVIGQNRRCSTSAVLGAGFRLAAVASVPD